MARDLIRRPVDLDSELRKAWAAVPRAWRSALSGVWRPNDPTPGPAVLCSADLVAKDLLSRCGWTVPGPGPLGEGEGRLSVLGSIPSVKDLTRILMAPVIADRAARHREFVVSAAQPDAWFVSGVPALAAVVLSSQELEWERLRVLHSLKYVWRLPWENAQKEVFWRLLVNGVSAAGGHDICLQGPCPCGWSVPGFHLHYREGWCRYLGAPALRAHCFWDCPVAQAVLAEVARGLPAGICLHRLHVWGLTSPCGAVCPAVWTVVCLAAVSAMHTGRKCCWSVHMSNKDVLDPDGFRQLTLYEAWGLDPPAVPVVLPPNPVQFAAGVAVADFWKRVQNFVVLQNAPRSPETPLLRAWVGSQAIKPGHPFIDVGVGDPRLYRVNIPAR
jgi:hypothetical protein